MSTATRHVPSSDDSVRPEYSPGLEGVIAGESALCQVDEGESGLRYRGYAIGDLAERSTFEEVAYLLLYGHLPTRKELDDFADRLRQAAPVPPPVTGVLGGLPRSAHPMDVVRTGISLLGLVDPDDQNGTHDANVRKAVRLMAQMPLIVAYASAATAARRQAANQATGGFAERLLWLLTGRRGDDVARAMARTLDVSLILYAEHEFNASTFAARVAASTLTDIHGAITAAVAALKGPLHGGANEAVAAMLTEIGDARRAESWVREALRQKRRIMGFGHRVLKHGDARSTIIRRHAETLSRACGETRWYDIAVIVERLMQDEKGLYPNLDFYTAVAYLLMGLPRELYTPIFVCSRITGWCAHVIEQQDHNRLIRPRALYTGPPPLAYVPIEKRV